VGAWQKAYGEDRVSKWIRMLEERGGQSLFDFESEDVLKE
jgi:hypothetical protein